MNGQQDRGGEPEQKRRRGWDITAQGVIHGLGGKVGRRTMVVAVSVVAAALGLALGALVVRRSAPAPEVPVPALDKLELQLRAYIEEKLKWVREAPRDFDRQATLGLVYSANGLWSEARVAFQNAARLKPSEPLARLYVAISTQEAGDRAQAIPLLQELTRKFPDFAPGFYRLGEAQLQAGAFEEAGPAFERLIALAPREWRGYAGLGEIKLRRGQPGEAATLLEQALKLDPIAKHAHYQLGQAYRALGRLEDAQWHLDLARNAVTYPMPDDWSVRAPQHMKLLQDLFDMANEYEAAGQPGQAVGILEGVRRFHPTNPAVLNNLAIAYNRSGDPGTARSLLLKVIEAHTNHLPAYVSLSHTFHLLGSNDTALAYAERAIALGTNKPQPYLAKANALLGAQRDTEALAALQTVASLDPQNPEIYVELGDVSLRNLERPAEALPYYQKAAQLDRTSLAAQVRLADLHLRLGQAKEARQALETARRIAPQERVVAVLDERLRKLQSRPGTTSSPAQTEAHPTP